MYRVPRLRLQSMRRASAAWSDRCRRTRGREAGREERTRSQPARESGGLRCERMVIHNRNGAIMAVLVKMNVPGMTEKDYDDVSGKLTEPVRKATGFKFHAGNVTKDGVTVTEVWATRENSTIGSRLPFSQTSREYPPRRSPNCGEQSHRRTTIRGVGRERPRGALCSFVDEMLRTMDRL